MEITKEQHTYEWYGSRLGNFTASQVSKLMGATDIKKDTFGDTAMSYICQVSAERQIKQFKWNGMSDDEKEEFIRIQYPQTLPMKWGNEHEASARALYCFTNNLDCNESGTHCNAERPHVTASPDGFIGDDSLIEIKCPKIETFAKYSYTIIDNETMKSEIPQYYWQVMLQMYVTGRDKCHFVWYHPLLGVTGVVINRNDDDIKLLLSRIDKAEEIVKSIIDKI